MHVPGRLHTRERQSCLRIYIGKYLSEAVNTLKEEGPMSAVFVQTCVLSGGKNNRRRQAPGGIDIFINSAAVTNRKPALEMSDEEWLEIINVNLNGAFYLGRAVGKHMIEHGREEKLYTLFLLSIPRLEKFRAYSASKAGVVMLMKTLALELAPYKICVNAIAPTATDTRFTADYYAKNPDIKEAVVKNHPFGRIAVPEDYMGTVIYLSSAASNFVTGEMIVVDGGKTAK